MTVHEVSRLTGVSIKTLHYYDQIGLLHPNEICENGYRSYNNSDLERLQQILLFKELKFSLKDIARILQSENFDRKEALQQQIALLTLQQNHLGELIAFAKKIYEKGYEPMNFEPLKNEDYKAYTAEIKQKWGDTKEYREFESRNATVSDQDMDSKTAGLMQQFQKFGACKDSAVDSKEALACVKDLQEYITANYYTCSNEILASLGLMYTADERFKTNIDSYGGEGTAAFASLAIAAYTSK